MCRSRVIDDVCDVLERQLPRVRFSQNVRTHERLDCKR